MCGPLDGGHTNRTFARVDLDEAAVRVAPGELDAEHPEAERVAPHQAWLGTFLRGVAVFVAKLQPRCAPR